jgi:hypothetical protein
MIKFDFEIWGGPTSLFIAFDKAFCCTMFLVTGNEKKERSLSVSGSPKTLGSLANDAVNGVKSPNRPNRRLRFQFAVIEGPGGPRSSLTRHQYKINQEKFIMNSTHQNTHTHTPRGPHITETQRQKQAQARLAKKQDRATLPPPVHPRASSESRPAEDEGPEHVGPHEAPPQANPG